jgi:hypothetical protein
MPTKKTVFDVYATGNISHYIGQFEAEVEEDAVDAAASSDAWQELPQQLCHQCSRRVGDFAGFELKAEKVAKVKHTRRPRPPGTPRAKR